MDHYDIVKLLLRWGTILTFAVPGTWLVFEARHKEEVKDQVHVSEMNEKLDEQEKEIARQHIRELIELMSDKYKVKSKLFGGIGEVEITLINHSKFQIDLVIVKVEYIKQNGELFKSEKLTFQNMKPNEMQHQYAPDSKRGTKLKTSIILVKSVELGL